ncbi:hypothetical protein BDP81DRAFT_435020 [Colletotrichum phormii]|uniref:Secreted protein n=1 Tax=Colletotrichum phormii TaxID=359342 RepID=A0AAI9ZJU5_9PEZI|nr:uncharacterized protein BDP81DRAFT_435020 [Colletotrichum phormii]KAK1625597.1 hypothetical protein BDP81DRAFT_435020 [Colletotrichum phormii]
MIALLLLYLVLSMFAMLCFFPCSPLTIHINKPLVEAARVDWLIVLTWDSTSILYRPATRHILLSIIISSLVYVNK